MAVTVSYNVKCSNAQGFPTFIINSTTPPTAQQASTVQDIFCQVAMTADTDTTAVITHNWGISASDSTNFGFPQILRTTLTGSTVQTFETMLTYDIVTSTNVVTVRKTGGASSGGTWNIHLRRAWTASQ